MRTFGFNFSSGKVFEFKSRKHAESAGNGIMIACSADDIVKSVVTTKQMAEMYFKHYNSLPDALRKDKRSAASMMIALAHAKAVKVQAPTTEAKPMSEETEVKSVKAPKKPKAESNGRKGRNSMFDGRSFRMREGITTNPRREGTKGYTSMAIVLLAGPKGIKYEDFLAQGGRRVDLAWDLVHDNIVVV